MIFPYSQSKAVTIGFEPKTQNIFLGSTINIDLFIWDFGDHTSPSLSVFDIDVSYNTMVLSFIDYKLSSHLGDISSCEALDLSYGEQQHGTINLANLSLLSPDELNSFQPSEFAFATLTFKAIAPGSSKLNFTNASLGDEQRDCLDIQIEPGNINVVPTPATILLLGSSFACLITERFMRRRNRKKLNYES